jgi:uncharacterized membrane protein
MGTLVKEIVVAAPADRVFAYLSDWRNVGKYQEEVHDYRPASHNTSGEGARFLHNLVTPRGELEVEVQMGEVVPNVGFTSTAIRGPRILERWRLAPADGDGKTRVTYEVTYPLPSGAAGGLMNLFMLKGFWSDRMNKTLRKLKSLVETSS